MASVKFLKKEISSIANELAMACLLSKAELTASDVEKVNTILAEIYDFEDANRGKAHCDTNGKTPQEVKQYYSALYSEIQQQAQAIVEKIKTLN